ncbi:zinc-dependent peptidase [Gilvimarinus agarilyticus]|uniref:M90 family metallopeptidase n=1 Tax=unclassified Gilvimarinus TaxID=2642066 RepID=UPI001C08469D|nr:MULTISPECIES: M90 family metallopeptidase [unclassified Gilvimarinus]MBU2886830.1 zinc-dependent peptidase [Gilvimarinus agarilyticus]MDO6571494.1 zinc-dependent peptidase [Gilvimarinus sp. 2_MG-2023]MDO6747325.1 zinc-dependent peptidase [Gilvimarinus sp. 1_MG-2023]
MFNCWRRWRDNRIVNNHPIDERDWQQVLARLPILAGLSQAELDKLRRMAILFIQQKDFVGIGGLQLTGNMALLIALQACLPILNLGLHWYKGWKSIIIYPAAFKARQTQFDQYGVAHEMEQHLAGQAWARGGVVLAWDETAQAGVVDGHNLVIHEFVHKLDMLNGSADGFPPLRPGMSAAAWTEAFSGAYEDFSGQVHRGRNTAIDQYAATNPAEFIAVTSEVFFELPALLAQTYPQVFAQYVEFYQQDPSQRLAS